MTRVDYLPGGRLRFSWPSMWDPSEPKLARIQNLAWLAGKWCAVIRKCAKAA